MQALQFICTRQKVRETAATASPFLVFPCNINAGDLYMRGLVLVSFCYIPLLGEAWSLLILTILDVCGA